MKHPDELNTFDGYHLRRASAVVMADLAGRLSKLGLRLTEASVLVVLRAHPRVTQSELGRRLSIQRANMAPLAAGLMARGLIQRVDAVGRTLPLTLTDTGAAQATAALQQMVEHEAEFFGAMDVSDRDRLRRLVAGLWRGR